MIRFLKYFLVGYLVGSLLVFGWSKQVDANESALLALRATTLRLPNGTGALVRGKSGKVYVLTNFHVCVGILYRGKFRGALPTGQSYEGKLVKADPQKDLCAAEPDAGTKSVLALNLSRRSRIGQGLYTRGYPNGVLMESHGTLEGEVQWSHDFPIDYVGECGPGMEKRINPWGVLEACGVRFRSSLTNLYSRPGSSGSPVVDVDGNLVGVVSSWHYDQDYSAGIVTYDQVKAFLDTL